MIYDSQYATCEIMGNFFIYECGFMHMRHKFLFYVLPYFAMFGRNT